MKISHLRFGCFFSLCLFVTSVFAEEKWKIHEWGTFTSLQNELGEAIGGVNTDDEPLPQFVHRLASFLLLQPTEIPATFFKGAPSCHPDVTMRLETPVIYFHPPKTTSRTTLDVLVKFRGGWLTEFFPAAVPDAPGLKDGTFQFPHLDSNTESKLSWQNLKLGGSFELNETTEHVWTSPRAVEAASVQTKNGESEKFLFYRGVAHINAPLKISRDTSSGELLLRSQLDKLPTDEPLLVPFLWLVDIQRDGRIAFRSLAALSLTRDPKKVLTHTPAVFATENYNSNNLKKLKTALKKALVSEGLFADEAQALLNTWELSYFKSAGLRLFFIAPRAWTDFNLPLEISQPAEINRVLIGRIELVTPKQRLGLQKIAGYSTSEIRAQATQLRKNIDSHRGTIHPEWNHLVSGKKPLSAFISVPDSYQTYLDLGRFRNALILEEAKTRPTEGLTNFISTYRLQAYKPQ